MAVEFEPTTVVDISDVTSINNNFQSIKTALQDALSRSGNIPNSMSADVDMNSNDIINVDNVHASTLVLGGKTVVPSELVSSSFLALDGSNSPTANISWGGFRHTDLGDATTDTDALNRQTADLRYKPINALNSLIYYVNDYGVEQSNTPAENDTAFAALLTTISTAGGGTIYWGDGTYQFASEHVWDTTSQLVMRGSARRGTIIQATATANSILQLGATSIGVQISDIQFDSSTFNTRGVDIVSGAVDHSFYRCKWTGSFAGLALCYSAASGFIEWHDCHFVSNNATTVGLRLNEDNQVWRLFNARFSGIGRGMLTEGTPANDIEGGRAIGCHFVNTGNWAVTLGPSFDTVFDNCTFDQQDVSCVILGEVADRVTFVGCYFGAPGANTTATLLDINADSGNDIIVKGCRFNGGGKAIHAKATATAGEYLAGLVVDGNTFLNQATVTLDLDSVVDGTIVNNRDLGTPTNGSWNTRTTNAINGNYTFDGNHWHTQNPALLAAAPVTYNFGWDTGIVFRAKGVIAFTSTTSVSNAHGMTRAPNHVVGLATANVGNFWNSVRNATNVGFTWSTSATGEWSWEATYIP